MANIPLKSIKFPDLADTYTVPSNAGELPYNKSATYPADTVGKALQNIGDSSAPAILETATGSIASFTDGANVPVKDLVAEIVPLQSGSDDPSPSNVRPISGWTECNVGVCGVNVLPTPDPDYTSLKGITMAIGDDGTLTLDGAATNTTYIRGKFVSPLPTGDYSFAMFNPVADSNIKISLRPENYDSGSVGGWHTMNSINDAFAFTTVAPAYYWQIQIDTGVTLNNFKLSPMMAVGSQVPTTYEPYNADSTTHTISFASAGTVYGGRLDVTSGVLVVDKAITDMGSLNYDYKTGAEYQFFYATVSGMKQVTSGEIYGLCSAYKWIGVATTTDMENAQDKSIGTYNGVIRVKDLNYTDKSDFKTSVTGQKLVYELANPQTYQLTPTEVKTLLKNNNIWADTGDVTVEYVADTKTFIENLVNA